MERSRAGTSLEQTSYYRSRNLRGVPQHTPDCVCGYPGEIETMRDFLRQRVRWSALALALVGAGLGAVQAAGIAAPMRHWFWNTLGIWGGVIALVVILGWRAAVIGAYRILDGEPAVATWLEDERRQALMPGIAGAVLSMILLVTAEELLLRGLLLQVGGPVATVAAAGALRWHSGRRTALWGILQALLLTAVALVTGNVLAAWVAHCLTEAVWLAYLSLAPWRWRLQEAEGAEQGC